jgi:hypothetical protein
MFLHEAVTMENNPNASLPLDSPRFGDLSIAQP